MITPYAADTVRRCVVSHCTTFIVNQPERRLCSECTARARRKLRTIKLVVQQGWRVERRG